MEIPKTQGKNTKLKENTQPFGGFHPTWETKWCYKKSLEYTYRLTWNLKTIKINYRCLRIVNRSVFQYIYVMIIW